MNIDSTFLIIECVACVAWGFYNSMLAMHKKMDVFGIWMIALTTTFGGGLVRDIILNEVPHCFTDSDFYLCEIVVTATSIACMILVEFPKIRSVLFLHENSVLLNVFDGIGLSIFCITGMQSAVAAYPENFVLTIFAGTCTGIGGGMIRDLFLMRTPYVFVKHVYALPCIIGSALYAVLYLKTGIGNFAAMLIGIGVIFVLRILATVFRWNLPVPGLTAEEKEELKRVRASRLSADGRPPELKK